METLKRIRFFEKNREFLVKSNRYPEFTYGQDARVFPDEALVTWSDARSHAVDVVRVGSNEPDRLVLVGKKQRFEFTPVRVAEFRRRIPGWGDPKTDEDARALIRADGIG